MDARPILKKVMMLLLICSLIFWIGKMYSINRYRPICIYYDIGDVVECGDLDLFFVESHLDDQDEFETRFDGNGSWPLDEECKMISICIEVTNRSDMDIGWDAVFDFLECGFESSVWGSSIDPMIGAEINRFESVSLSSGKSQRIWFFTEVQKVCFKESSWENIADYKYSYVLSLIPQKVAVRLDV